jgi:UPF0755 protein
VSFLKIDLLWRILLIICLLVGIFVIFNLYTSFVKSYPIKDLVVDDNMTTFDLVNNLNSMGVSVDYYEFRLIQILFNHGILAGSYEFNNTPTLYQLSSYLDSAQNIVAPNKLSIPEGFNNEKILNRLDTLDLPMYDRNEFEALIADREGYLFPDTYLLEETITAGELFAKISANFEDKTSVFQPPLTSDEVILASIVEREVSDATDRRMVADILLRRLQEGMRLQVDASLDYYLDKASVDITLDELAEDHPYNTYRNNGLPPTAISNPGLDSMIAVREPISNEYWFYLSAPDGKTYYAETFQGHVENKEKYLP